MITTERLLIRRVVAENLRNIQTIWMDFNASTQCHTDKMKADRFIHDGVSQEEVKEAERIARGYLELVVED